MTQGVRGALRPLDDAFWLLPGAMVLGGVALATVLLGLDRTGWPAEILPSGPWLYSGDATGARTLLGTVASSTIGVAGTVFSITIAALSLAAGQMGPRLLRNFTRDRGNQATLGVFLGTFAYALIVLRAVRAGQADAFVPHLSLAFAILLAFVSVAMLVFFVGHMAGRINVYTVIDLVSDDVRRAVRRLMTEAPPSHSEDDEDWAGAVPIPDAREGYLQQILADRLADWAARNGTRVKLLARSGDYHFPGAAIALMTPEVAGAAEAIAAAIRIGPQQVSNDDLQYAVRELVEVAVRALSPAINAPMTAMSVLDRLGAALCDAVPLHLASGVIERDGRVVLRIPRIDYGDLVDLMFHMIRQNARGAPAVLIRALEVLTAIVSTERAPDRQGELRRHADLLLQDATRQVANPSDLADIERRHATFERTLVEGPLGRPGTKLAPPHP